MMIYDEIYFGGGFGDHSLLDKSGTNIQQHINKFIWELFFVTETRSQHNIKNPCYSHSIHARAIGPSIEGGQKLGP